MRTVWPILIALGLGIIIGLLINQFWTPGTWQSLGITDAPAFLSGKPQVAEQPANQPAIAAHAVKFAINAADFIGQLFIKALRLAAVPIVLFSIIVGVASLGDPRRLGRLGSKTIGLYTLTTFIAVILGMVIANTFRPGDALGADAKRLLLASAGQANVEAAISQASASRSIWGHLLAMVPANPFDALARGDMLQVIVLAALVGATLTLLPNSKQKGFVDICDTLAQVFGRIVTVVMSLAPFAVFCLIVPVVAGLGVRALAGLGVYIFCVLGGLLTILILVYAPMVKLLGGMSPLQFYRGIGPAQVVAFSSSSSNATLPVTLSCVTDRLGVPRKIANFVCPLGATINMDGTALYQGVAVLFIAQAMGIDLSLAQQAGLVFGAVLASIGSPGIPGGSLVFLIGLLTSVGIPPQGIALILGVDRVLDMARTVVNVSGDAAVAVALKNTRV